MATPPSPDDWTNCPQGEIAGLVHSLKSRRRRETYTRAVAVTSAMLVVAFVASSLVSGWFRGQEPIPAIACKKVIQLAPHYVSHKLDVELTVQIDQHLKDCKGCRVKIHTAYPKFPLPAGSPASICPSTPIPLAVVLSETMPHH